MAVTTLCPNCGAALAVQPYSYTDATPQAREIVRSMLHGHREDDGSILAIAEASGVVACPECRAEVGTYDAAEAFQPIQGSSAEQPHSTDGRADWEVLRASILEEFQVEIDEPSEMGLRFEVPGDRTQSVVLREVSFGDSGWVEIATGVGVEGDVDPLLALRVAAGIEVGGLVIQNGLIVYRLALPLAELNQREFRRAFAHIVNVGDRVERALSPASGDQF